MNIIKKWNSTSLILRIFIGLVIGAILGLAAPGLSWISVLGTLFVGALKAVAPILVFVLVSSSLANAKGGAGSAAKFRRVIFLYLFSTLCAAVVAVIVNFAHPVTLSLAGLDAAAGYTAPGSMSEIVMNLLTSIIANPVDEAFRRHHQENPGRSGKWDVRSCPLGHRMRAFRYPRSGV